MRKNSNLLSKTITDLQKSILKERLIGKNNLVYYASGKNINDAYTDIPYDNIVLVDPCFGQPLKIEGKVICLALWSTFATALFKEMGIKFNAFVTGNDGLSEGGGKFPINGNHSLSNVLPVMNDDYLHIAFPSQYRKDWKKLFLDMPLESTLLNPDDKDYIDPKIFTLMNKPGSVWKVTKKVNPPVAFMLGKRKITVQQKNIWDDYDVLDSLFVRCPPVEKQNLKTVYKKIELVKDFSFEQILQYCTKNNITKLGLCPWLGGNYNSFMDFIKAAETKYPFPYEFHFYHLHGSDMKQLYARA